MKWAVSVLMVVAMLGSAAVLVLVDVPVATADDSFDFFFLEVEHGINGRSLGLSKDLPLTVTFTTAGADLLELALSFKDSAEEILPTGIYTITVESIEAGALSTMTLGPVEMLPGDNLHLKATIGAGKTPRLVVR